MRHTAIPYRHRALGIDPGLAQTGYAVIGCRDRGGELCDWGSVTTSARLKLPERLQRIYTEIRNLLSCWKPDVLALEDVYVYTVYPKAAIQLGEVRGVICLAAQDSGLPVHMIKPTEVKSCLTGNGRATKEQVQRSVQNILRRHEPIKPDHASDAAALALIAASRQGFYQW